METALILFLTTLYLVYFSIDYAIAYSIDYDIDDPCTDYAITTAVITIAIFLCIQFFTNVPPIGWAITNPVMAIISVAVYILCGILWSIFRWTNLQKRYSDAYVNGSVKVLQATMWDKWPTFSTRRALLGCWLVIWPAGVTRYLLQGWVLNGCYKVFGLLEGVYSNITDKYKQSATEEFKRKKGTVN